MKQYLLDTHILIWWLEWDKRLTDVVYNTICDGTNDIFVSAASVWEIAIKKALGKLNAPDNLTGIVEKKGFQSLPISLFHGERAGALPAHHNDPFDRMLIAQAQTEGLVLITHDTAFKPYGNEILWAT